MRIVDAINRRIGQARLMGWRPGPRVLIDIEGRSAALTMSWVAASGDAMIQADPADQTVARGNVIRLEGDLPKGVTATAWSALPDTVDTIAVPSEADIADAARLLGCAHYERLDYPDKRTAYRMVGVGTGLQRDKLRRYGEALYGERWQSDLARALGINDRRVRQWLTGDRPIPPGVWTDISKLLQQRQQQISELLNEAT